MSAPLIPLATLAIQCQQIEQQIEAINEAVAKHWFARTPGVGEAERFTFGARIGVAREQVAISRHFIGAIIEREQRARATDAAVAADPRA